MLGIRNGGHSKDSAHILGVRFQRLPQWMIPWATVSLCWSVIVMPKRMQTISAHTKNMHIFDELPWLKLFSISHYSMQTRANPVFCGQQQFGYALRIYLSSE